MVADALQDHVWPADISGGLSLVGLFEYFQLWDVLHETILSQDDDVHVWRLEGSGQFTSKSASSVLQWLHHLFALATSMDILGTSKVQAIFMVSNSKQVLDGGPISQERIASPEPLPLVRSGG